MDIEHRGQAPDAEDGVLGIPSRVEPDNVITSDKDPNARLVSRLVAADDIRLCAYQKWEKEGRPVGDSVRFWLAAEQEVAKANSEC